MLLGISVGLVRGQQLAAGPGYTLVIKPDGTLWGWGENAYGQLGDGTTRRRGTPVRIGSAADWQQLTTAGASTYALRQDGTLWAWGYHCDGPRTPGADTLYLAPRQVAVSKWRSISTAGSYAVRRDGTLWGRGHNEAGQLGDSTFTYSAGPRQIGTSHAWSSVFTASAHSFALRRDGSLWAWGDNTHGPLGTGHYSKPYSTGYTYSSTANSLVTRQKTPVQVGHARWRSVSIGPEHILAIQWDNTLWQWGLPCFDQLGGGKANVINSVPQR